MATIEFFFDFSSPCSDLAATRLGALAERAGATRGAFGAPTIFVGDQLFVGNDRLHFVERAAKGERIYR